MYVLNVFYFTNIKLHLLQLNCNSLDAFTQFDGKGCKSERPLFMCVIKGIRDAGSTADFRIRFEILKFENLENFGTFKIF